MDDFLAEVAALGGDEACSVDGAGSGAGARDAAPPGATGEAPRDAAVRAEPAAGVPAEPGDPLEALMRDVEAAAAASAAGSKVGSGGPARRRSD